MDYFVGRHTIRMPAGEEPLLRHYAIPAASSDAAKEILRKIDDGMHPATTCEVIGHVVDYCPVCDLLPT